MNTFKNTRIYVTCFTFIIAIAFLNGCANRKLNRVIEIPFVTVPEDVTVADDFSQQAPTTVAVLPFKFRNNKFNSDRKTFDDNGNLSKEEQRTFARTTLRKIFFDIFSTLSYHDIDIHVVDSILTEHGLTNLEKLYATDPKEFKTLLGADAIITGELDKAYNYTAGIAAETVIEGTLSMINTTTGETLWTVNHYEANKGNLLKNSSELLDLIESQVKNANVQLTFTRVAEEFSRKVVNSIPDEGQALMSTAISPPTINTVLVETPDLSTKIFLPGDNFIVSMTGDPGMVATFDIGLWKLGIPMQETRQGTYIGSYSVQYGDETTAQPIVGKLTNRHGITSVKFLQGAQFTCRGKYLNAPYNLSGSFDIAKHTVSLSWNHPERQIKEFVIYRADNDNPAFSKIGTSHKQTFSDSIDPARIKSCSYQIVAYDSMGTISTPSEPVTITIAKE